MRHRIPLVFFSGWLVASFSASADTPAGRYVVNAADDTVSDTRAVLTWQRTVSVTTYTQAEASSYCEGIALAGAGWRLPRISELLTLVDPTRVDAAIDPEAFPNTPSEWFWSSSAYFGGVDYAWGVYFTDGASSYDYSGNSGRVRCVR